MEKRRTGNPKCTVLVILLLALPFPASTSAENDPYEKLVFKAAIFGPSDEIFIWWGHAAIIVEDTAMHASLYDWGIFSYPSDSFIKDFALNNVRYRCGTASAWWDIRGYIEDDRDIVIYTLDLESDKKKEMLDYMENNILPENSWYTYHQFYDNCSTRIRDIIDMGTGGQLKEHTVSSRGRFTLREHLRRFTWYSPFYDWFIGFLLGRDIDKNTTVWEEMFLPVELARVIENCSYTDSSGNERQLVTGVEIVNQTENRTAILDAPRSQLPRSLTAGLAIAALPALILLLRKKMPRTGKILFDVSQSLAGLAFGSAGTILFLLSRIEERDIMRHNINLLFINPLLLLAVPLGIGAAVGKKITVGKHSIACNQCLWIIWLYAAAAALGSTLLGFFIPALYQENQSAVLLILPVTLVFLGALFRLNMGFLWKR
jgi:hypothetical protein